MNARSLRLSSGLIAAVFLAASLWVGVASAQTPTPSDDQVNAVASQLYCPVCQNIPLDVCPTQACIQWRDLIRQKLAAGWTQQQIKDYFAQQYGERVLAAPPLQKDFNRLLPVLIGLSLLAGIALVVLAFRRVIRPGPQTPPANASPTPPAGDDEYAARLEAELEKRKRS
jgi:cytochrome c-type biogenesis protein CcmH